MPFHDKGYMCTNDRNVEVTVTPIPVVVTLKGFSGFSYDNFLF